MTVYLLWAADELLVAESLAELAEIYECALEVGDSVKRLRALERGRARLLRHREFALLLELANSAHGTSASN